MIRIVTKTATDKDVLLIKNLSWQTFFDTFHKENAREDMELFLTSNFNENAVRAEIADTNNTFLIAYIKKDAVGYAKLSEGENPEGLNGAKALEISRLYSVKEKIGSGVGKTLMEKSFEVARKKNKDVIWLGVWEHNQRAIQFYRRFGFEKFGEHVFMLGNDKQNDWLMKKHLTELL
jgi:diamine N-acetyltransferase